MPDFDGNKMRPIDDVGNSRNKNNFCTEVYELLRNVCRFGCTATKRCENVPDWQLTALKHFEVRLLDGMPVTTVQTVIRLNFVTFYSFGNPPLVYVLKSKTVYEDYKKFFFMLWDKAKPA